MYCSYLASVLLATPLLLLRHCLAFSLTTACIYLQAERRAIVATAMIVVGCIVLVVFGNHQSRSLTVEELLHYFRK